VASDRQVAANRENAKRSTGPRSRGGKSRACRNATVHGLAGRSPIDPNWIAAVERLAKKIVDSTGGKIDLVRARAIAEAQQELIRARSISSAVIEKIWPADEIDDGGKFLPSGSSSPGKEVERSIELSVSLRVLDRYEHRALARRNREIRRCIE